MTRANVQIAHLIGGTVGGLVGTAAMAQGMRASQKLPPRFHPPAMRDDPGEFMVRKLEDARGRTLSPKGRARAAKGLHWAYGTLWGSLLGALAPSIGVHTVARAVLLGGALGAGVWAAGYVGWLPAAGLTQPIHKQGAPHVATALLSHVLYGIAVALPLYGIVKLWRAR